MGTASKAVSLLLLSAVVLFLLPGLFPALAAVALVAVGLWVAREYVLPPPVGSDP